MPSHDDKVAAMERNLLATTGRTLQQWIEIVRAEGLPTAAAQREWLKSVHGVGHFQARLIVSKMS